MLVLGLFDPVQTHAGMRRAQLQVKGRGFDCCLLVASRAWLSVKASASGSP
jgi:hypothetical protein